MDGYITPKITDDMMASLAIVLEKFAGTFCSADGMDIVHDFLNNVYGLHNIAITRGALNVCDEIMLAAVMSHEISHILCMDAVFHRIIFANITLAITGLIVSSFTVTSLLWIIFGGLCLFGICRGCVSIFCFSGISKMIKGIFELMQRFVLFVYQTIMGIVSRKNEYRADQYACSLGYGIQLKYFLSRFMEGQDRRQRALRDILYASHPATYKRIERIEQHREKFSESE